MTCRLVHGDCLDVLPTVADRSVDCVITDPPYPEIDREYGRWTEAQWWSLVVEGVVPHVRRILKPTGSAVFILQPNSRKVGSMRGWLWRFMAWACDEWNMVQDVWWWNVSAPPTVHVHRDRGLMRPSVKACVWLGDPDCHRDQDKILWGESASNAAERITNDRVLRYQPSGLSMRKGRCAWTARERGGVTPFNLIPIPACNTSESRESDDHGARTPYELADWWVRYLCPHGGVVLDPFSGSGTTGLAAINRGLSYIGFEQERKYHLTAERRIAGVRDSTPLFAGMED